MLLLELYGKAASLAHHVLVCNLFFSFACHLLYCVRTYFFTLFVVIMMIKKFILIFDNSTGFLMVDLQFYMCVLSMCIIVLCPCASLLTKMAGNSKREKFDDVSSITHETHSAIVHGRVIELSPVKTSRKNEKVKYFDCKLTDGKEVYRMVSFEPKVWPDIEEFVERGESVSVVNCDVKKRKIGGTGYELVLSDSDTFTKKV